MNLSISMGLVITCVVLAGCAGERRARAEDGRDDACPMEVRGATVRPAEVEGGVALDFTTARGNVEDLRARVEQLAVMHNDHHAPGTPMHRAQGGPMLLPVSLASTESLDHGARLILRPHDASQLQALRQHTHWRAERMAAGVCPRVSPGRG